MIHRVKVRREWLTDGEVIELELPRNLSCATCGGGGCDTCGRSGAITLRQRDEPPEVVEVTLPVRSGSDTEPLDGPGVTLRIPEQGGLPEPGSELPRGTLLLTVVPSETPDPRVYLARSSGATKGAGSGEHEPRGGSGTPHRAVLIVVAIVVVALWILLLAWLRLSGQG